MAAFRSAWRCATRSNGSDRPRHHRVNLGDIPNSIFQETRRTV